MYVSGFYSSLKVIWYMHSMWINNYFTENWHFFGTYSVK